MKYSMGACLSEFGFKFYEKLHEPIFLISKIGKIVKVNEAGRKLMGIGKLSVNDLEAILEKHISSFTEFISIKKTVIATKNQKLHLTTCKLPDSEYFLVEVMR